jgi:hypothetical protein
MAWLPTNVCSRARETTTFSNRYALVYVKRQKTTTFRHRPSQGDPVKTETGPAWNEREQDGQKKIASRAGKTLINSVQLESGGPEGPQNRCSRARETTTFSNRYALVYVKQPLVN